MESTGGGSVFPRSIPPSDKVCADVVEMVDTLS